MSDTSTNTPEQIGTAVIDRFIKDELVTKSELSLNLDRVMEKYTNNINSTIADLKQDINFKIADLKQDVDKRFEQVDKRFEQIDRRFEQVDNNIKHVDNRYSELKRTIISVGIALGGLAVGIASLTSHFH